MTSKPGKLAQPRPLQLLTRLLEEPELVGMVQALPPRALCNLIQHIGLEDCGELISLATTEQLKKVFDEDLWRSERPGKDESFDADRFALWLEVMLEAGDEFTAERLTELPEDLVTLALHRHIMVINIDELAVEMADRGEDDDDLTEKALDSCLYHEIGEYQIISKRHDGWDAIVSVLLALDQNHQDFLQRVLARCCRVSTAYIEENGGLHNVLTSDDMLESDAAAEREDRRATEGFVAPTSAASFLGLARQTPLADILAAQAPDPVTRAYFRVYAPGPALTTAAATRAQAREAAEQATKVARLLELLGEANVLPEADPALLLEGDIESQALAAQELFKQAIVELQEHNAVLHTQRMSEFGYLANVLLAGCSVMGRSFRPFEAAEAAVAVCTLGLEHLLDAAPGKALPTDEPLARAAQELARTSADKLFRIGWRLLHGEVSLPAGRTLDRVLARKIPQVDTALATQLTHFARAVQQAVVAGKPWTVRGKLESLEPAVDAPTLLVFASFLSEMPAMPVPAKPDCRPAAREYELIATAEQLRRAQAILEML